MQVYFFSTFFVFVFLVPLVRVCPCLDLQSLHAFNPCSHAFLPGLRISKQGLHQSPSCVRCAASRRSRLKGWHATSSWALSSQASKPTRAVTLRPRLQCTFIYECQQIRQNSSDRSEPGRYCAWRIGWHEGQQAAVGLHSKGLDY